MSLNSWIAKFGAGVALIIGVAVATMQNSRAQEAAEDVLIVHDGPGPAETKVEALDVIRLKSDAVKLAAQDMQKKIIAIKGGAPGKVHSIREAAAALNEAKDEDARDEAKKKLGKLLDQYFEEDMERREQELAQVEERVKKLRSTLERRREKKNDILDLQMEVLLNEADGLGFFGSEGFGGPGGPYELKIMTGPPMGMPWQVGPPAGLPPAAPAPAAKPRAATPPQPARAGFGGGRGGGGFGGGSGFGRGGFGIAESERVGEADREGRFRWEREEGEERERESERGRDRDREQESDEEPPR